MRLATEVHPLSDCGGSRLMKDARVSKRSCEDAHQTREAVLSVLSRKTVDVRRQMTATSILRT